MFSHKWPNALLLLPCRTGPDPAERPAKPAADDGKPAPKAADKPTDRAAARAAGRAADKAANAVAASAAEQKADRAEEAEVQPKEAGRRKESAETGNGLSKRHSSRADPAGAAAAAATPMSSSSRGASARLTWPPLATAA